MNYERNSAYRKDEKPTMPMEEEREEGETKPKDKPTTPQST